MSSPPALLPTAGIADGNTRSFLDRLVQVWGRSFVQRDEVRQIAAEVAGEAFSRAALSTGQGPAAQAVESITRAVYANLAQRVMEQIVSLKNAILAAGAITFDRLQPFSGASKLLGRGSAAGAGAPEEISIGTGFTMAGTTLNVNPGGAAHDHTTADGTGPLTNDEHDGFVEFSTSAVPSTPAAGKVRIFAEDAGGVARLRVVHQSGSNLALFRDSVTRVKNTSGGALAVGNVVYVTGATGNFPTVAKAKADAAATMPAFGLVLAAAADGAFTTVQFAGVIGGLDTSAFAEGAIVFVSTTTAGTLTTTEPQHPFLSQAVGVVTKSNAGAGQIQLAVSQAHEGDDFGTNRATWNVGSNAGGGAITVAFKNGFTGNLNWTPTAARNLTLPDASGTVALTSQITGTNSGTNTGDQFTATAASRLIGRGSAGGAGAAQEITLGAGLTMTGTTLSAAAGTGAELVSAFLTGTQANGTTTPAVLTGHTFTLTPGQVISLHGQLIASSASATTGVVAGVRVAQAAGADANAIGSVAIQQALANAALATGLFDGDAFNVAANTNALFEVVGTATTTGNVGCAYQLTVKNLATNANATVTIEFRSEDGAATVTAQIGTSCAGVRG